MKFTLILLATALGASAQFVRIDPSQITTTSNNFGSAANPLLAAVPNSPVTFCTYNGTNPTAPCVPGGTNLITTYTAANGVACDTSTQVVLLGTSACTSKADKAGQFGAWVVAGATYTYSFKIGTIRYGPFPITASGVSGSPGTSPITVGPLSSRPAIGTLGTKYEASDQQPNQQYSSWTGQQWTPEEVEQNTYSVRTFGAKCDGSTDDTSAFGAWITFLNGNPGAVGYVPGGVCLVNGRLGWDAVNWIRGDGQTSTYIVNTSPTADLFMATASNKIVFNESVSERLSDLTLAGTGAQQTGHLLVLRGLAGNATIDNVGFMSTGGQAVLQEVERCYFTNIRWYGVRQALVATNQAVNESFLRNFQVINGGLVANNLNIGNFSTCNFNINSSACAFPASGTIIQDQHALIDLGADTTDYAIANGSIKPTYLAAIKMQSGNLDSVSHVYMEGFTSGDANPSIIVGGNHEKTTLSNTITAGQLIFDLADAKWFRGSVGLLGDIQTDRVDPPTMLILPPDYVRGSSAASSLGNGILKGNFEIVQYNGIVHDATGSGWHVNLSIRAAGGTTAYAWPAGAVFEEAWGNSILDKGTINFPGALKLESNFYLSFGNLAGGPYTLGTNPDAEQTNGEIIVGIEPDNYFLPGDGSVRGGFQPGIQLTGGTQFNTAGTTTGNIDTYIAAGVDFRGTGFGGLLECGGSLASSTTISACAAGAHNITREILAGSNGTFLQYQDGSGQLTAQAVTTLTGQFTDFQGHYFWPNVGSTPANPPTGFLETYNKAAQWCQLNSSGVENCGLGGFAALTGGTNTIAAMLVGTGATLGPTGSGTVTANAYSGSVQGNGSKVQLSTGTTTNAHCAQFDPNGNIVDAGGACGIAGGGSAFSAITSATNTTATMHVGTGAALDATGSGTIAATSAASYTGTAQGNGTKLQRSTGTTTTDDCVKFDANGNTVDAGAACGGGGTGVGSVNNTGLGVNFTVVAGVATGIRAETPTDSTAGATTMQPAQCGQMLTLSTQTTSTFSLGQPGAGGNFIAGCTIRVLNFNSGTATGTVSGGGPVAKLVNGGSITSSATITLLTGHMLYAVSNGTNWEGFIY